MNEKQALVVLKKLRDHNVQIKGIDCSEHSLFTDSMLEYVGKKANISSIQEDAYEYTVKLVFNDGASWWYPAIRIATEFLEEANNIPLYLSEEEVFEFALFFNSRLNNETPIPFGSESYKELFQKNTILLKEILKEFKDYKNKT